MNKYGNALAQILELMGQEQVNKWFLPRGVYPGQVPIRLDIRPNWPCWAVVRQPLF